MWQFEPEIVQNIIVCQHKKNKSNDKPKRPAGGDAREGNISFYTQLAAFLIKKQKVHLKNTR